jgi:hypothetical protein
MSTAARARVTDFTIRAFSQIVPGSHPAVATNVFA